MDTLTDTRSIFRQLAMMDHPQAVKNVIESQDAASRSGDIYSALTPALLLRLGSNPVRDARIEAQRQALLPLVTTLRRSLANAG